MRTVTIAIALIVAVGCGDSEPCDNVGGAGGFGGAGGVGGSAGGAGGAPEDFGELVECYSYPEGSRTQRYIVQTEPGDLVAYTGCYAYLEENGEALEPILGTEDGCETWTEVAEGNEVWVFCSDSLTDDDGVVYYREGFGEVWVRFEESQ